MGWHKINGRRYYYSKKRAGERVLSIYRGAGFMGEASEILDQESKARRLTDLAQQRRDRTEIITADQDTSEVVDLALNMLDAFLQAAGYHKHKGQWRKRRVLKR